MPRTITTHAPAECGCQATSWYASSDDGMFDDSDTHVDACEWHSFQEDAFNTFIFARNAGTIEWTTEYNEIYWLQVAERETEYATWAYDHAWSQVRPASDATADFPF